MATDQAKPKGRKEKVASEQVASRKSSRISDLGAAKRKAAEDMSPSSIKKRKPEEEEKLAEKPAVKKTKKAEEKKKKEQVEQVEQVEAPASTKKKTAPKKAQQKQKKAPKVPELAEEEKAEEPSETVVEEEAAEEEEDDTTKALVKDLDSGDEESGGASLFEPGQDVGKVPAVAPKKRGAANKGKSSSAVAAANSSDEQRGGVVYIGRIPHGFFEHEMRSYFSQFGDIRRLRLSRNRRTGASKHYAFIEFSDPDVAEIVAQTMDSYLLFGHILRCSVVPPERIPANLFAGANRRFKVVPWNRLAGRQLAEPKSESGWEAQVSRESKRRSKRASLLQEKIGYAYEAPSLKKPVAALKAPGEEAEAEAEADKAIEAPKENLPAAATATEDEVAAPAEKEEEEEDKKAEAAAAAPKEAKAGKAKKARGKKSKA